MNKQQFLELAKFSIILAQARARAFKLSDSIIELWTIQACRIHSTGR